MSALLQTRELTLRIADRLLVDELTLDIHPGQSWAVLGPNGAGKSTLLHTLAGLRAPDGGEILWQSRPLPQVPRRELAQQLGLLFQDDLDPFPATVLETVLSGRHPHLGRWQWEGPEDLAIARQALADADLATLSERAITTLSGGERRRLAIATLLAQQPRLALLDEPTNHLDLKHQVVLLDKLASEFAGDRAWLQVSHDLNQALQHADHLLLLYGDGRHEAGSVESLADVGRFSELYGHPMRKLEGAGQSHFVPA